MLAAAPKVLVMDEPTFGQDFTMDGNGETDRRCA